MSLLNYFEMENNEEINKEIQVTGKMFEETEKKLTSIQRAQRKYLKKYQQTDKYKKAHIESNKKYYEENKKEIYENRRKRMFENPELYEKFKEQQRLYSQRRREMKKSQKINEIN